MSNKIEINLDNLTEQERKEWIEKLQAVDIKKPVKRWEHLGKINGFYINAFSNIKPAFNRSVEIHNKNLFKTDKQALSSLAYAQLTQLMADVNGDWDADWTNSIRDRWCIDAQSGELWVEVYDISHCFLAFPTEEIAEEFLENHRELIEQFYQL